MCPVSPGPRPRAVGKRGSPSAPLFPHGRAPGSCSIRDAGVWVSTEVQAYFYMQAAMQGFRRLFK